MKKKLCMLLMLFAMISGYSKELTFPFYAGSFEYMTIKQNDDLFCSAFDIGSSLFFENVINANVTENKDEKKLMNWQNSIALILYEAMDSIVFIPITHEEAHRAVLTSKNIGSISQPIIKMVSPLMGAAYVKGVTDAALKNLRETDFPVFIRMHTAGLESDYSIMQKNFSELVFEYNDVGKMTVLEVPPCFWEYYNRTISIVGYEVFNVIGKGIGITEETDELERDIVGDDICGMIHHLFNSQAEYHRYYSKQDFSNEEKGFLKRVAFKSLLNLPFVNTLFLRKYIPMDFNKVHFNFNAGYSLAPYGDYIDENIYCRIDDVMCSSLNLTFTARQSQNKKNWFPEFIIKCEQFSPFNWLTLNAAGYLWWQPENFGFTTDKSFVGGAFSLGCNFYPFKKNENSKYEFGINMNLLYKTKGFMPEIMALNEDLCLTAGVCLRY